MSCSSFEYISVAWVDAYWVVCTMDQSLPLIYVYCPPQHTTN